MTIAELFAAAQGLAITDAVEIEVSGMILQVLSIDSKSGALVLTANTPNTVSMQQAQAAHKDALDSLNAMKSELYASKSQAQQFIDLRVKDYVDKGIIHNPPHGADEAALLYKIQQGQM